MATVTNAADNEVVRVLLGPTGLLVVGVETNDSAATASIGRAQALELHLALGELLAKGIASE